jgi:hypothetical protein
VGEQMAKEIIHGERLDPGGHGGDERVIFWTQTSKKIRDEFEVIQRLTGGGKSSGDMFEPLEIIGDGGRSFLCGGELVVQVHGPGSDGGGEARSRERQSSWAVRQPRTWGRRSSEMEARSMLRIN